jgi:alanine racemase
MPRPSTAIINLNNLRHNCRYLKNLIKPSKIMTVMKANAYGHGAVQCASAIENLVDGFSVAFPEEAIELRQSGIIKPILVLEGFFDTTDLQIVSYYKLDVVIHSFKQIDILAKTKLTSKINIWLKLDSGMCRLGFNPKDYHTAWNKLQKISQVKKVILMSHFSTAGNADDNYYQKQITVFNSMHFNGETSFCNSAASINFNIKDTWKRIGLLLYGVSPFAKEHQITKYILPVMELKSAIISIKTVAKGERVGYGGLVTTTKDTVVGVVAIGYADGYPICNNKNAAVIVHQQQAPILGQVSMDMLTIDLSNIPQAKIGDQVILWGKPLSVNKVAEYSGLIPWQILCNVNRVKILYTTE